MPSLVGGSPGKSYQDRQLHCVGLCAGLSPAQTYLILTQGYQRGGATGQSHTASMRQNWAPAKPSRLEQASSPTSSNHRASGTPWPLGEAEKDRTLENSMRFITGLPN